MTKVVVIGAGIAGISAAVGARKAGAEVILLDKQDLVVGIDRIAGSMDVGGRYPLHEDHPSYAWLGDHPQH